MDRKKLFFTLKKCSKVVRKVVPGSVRVYVKEKLLEKDVRNFSDKKESFAMKEFGKGVNLIGSIRAENGLGQSCRLVAGQLERSGINFSVFNIHFGDRLREEDHTYDQYLTEELPYGINLFHINPCELGDVFLRMPDMWKKHYNIAFWLWELEEFPDEWVKYCSLFDEIWTPSAFAGQGIKKKSSVPVKTMPYTITVSANKSCTRKTFGLPDGKFLYLVMYDLNSTNGRKNPQGAIEAYKKAFPIEENDHGLVIKVNNAEEKELCKLRNFLSGYHNVYIISEIMTKDKVDSLIGCVDVFVSLHRSEGLGLVLAEAMCLGTPVIATNWSSNTEFMDSGSSCMVKYRLVASKKREGLYKKGCIWAEPDIEDAALYMRKLKNNLIYYEDIKEKGKKKFCEMFCEERLANLWLENIQVINKK